MDAPPSNPFSFLEMVAAAKPAAPWAKTPDTVITNAEAVEKAKKIAYELRRLGVQRGEVVALNMADRIGILFSLAVLHEAATSTVIPEGWVPTGDLKVHWLFTVKDQPAVPPGTEVVHVDSAFLQRIEENPYGIRPADGPVEHIRIVFSSGTTGSPKGIGVGGSASQAMATTPGVVEQWAEGSPHLNLMDMGTAWGVTEFYMSGYAGLPYLAVGGSSQSEIVRMAKDNAVRRIMGSPAQVAALVDELERQGTTITGVEAVVTTGTIMPPGLAGRVRLVIPGARLSQLYASTEAGGAAVRPYESDDPWDAGIIAPGSTLEIVDDEDQPVETGTVGRIRYRSPSMVDRYLGDDAATARSFRDGWFYPGDRGFIRPDGGLTLAGRDSELLNAGGVKIDPNRLDQFVLQREGVVDACSFEYETASGVQAVGIALVAEDDLDVESLVGDLQTEFARAAPTLVAQVDAIPKTRNGKPQRRTLAEQYAGS